MWLIGTTYGTYDLTNKEIRVPAGKKLPPRRFPTVGIVWKVPSTQTQLSHKHHHHGGDVCPSYGLLTMDTPNRTRATPSEGVGEERFSLV